MKVQFVLGIADPAFEHSDQSWPKRKSNMVPDVGTGGTGYRSLNVKEVVLGINLPELREGMTMNEKNDTGVA